MNRLTPQPDSAGSNNLTSQHTREYFVDAAVAAAFLSITRKYLLKLSRLCAVPAHPLGTGTRKQWRYRLSELEEWGLAKGADRPDNKDGSPGAAKKGGK